MIIGDFAVQAQPEQVNIGLLDGPHGYLSTSAILTKKLCSTHLKPLGFSTIPCNGKTHISVSFAWNGVTVEELSAILLA